MAKETVLVRGSGGAVFEVDVTPRVLKKLKSGVLVKIDGPKTRRAPAAAPKEPKAPKEPTDPSKGEDDSSKGPGADGAGEVGAGEGQQSKPAENDPKAG